MFLVGGGAGWWRGGGFAVFCKGVLQSGAQVEDSIKGVRAVRGSVAEGVGVKFVHQEGEVVDFRRGVSGEAAGFEDRLVRQPILVLGFSPAREVVSLLRCLASGPSLAMIWA